MKQKQNFGFYMETIIMLLVFMIAISNIVRVFTASYGKSRNAEHLTDAVILASNGAELVLASQSPEEIMVVLKDAGPEEGNDAAEAAGTLFRSWTQEQRSCIIHRWKLSPKIRRCNMVAYERR